MNPVPGLSADNRSSCDPAITIMAARFYPEKHGGVETHMWELSNQLAVQGIATEVWTENRAAAEPVEQLHENLRIVRREPLKLGCLWRWHSIVRLRWWMQMLHEHNPAPRIWATDPIMATAVILSGYRDRLVFNPPGCIAAMRHIGRLHPRITSMQVKRQVEWFDRFAFRFAPKVIVGSENVAQQFDRFYTHRKSIQVQPLTAHAAHGPSFSAVELAMAKQRLGLAEKDFVIGFVGRLDPCKDMDFLLRSMHMNKLHPQMKLLIAGEGPDEECIRNLAQSMGLSESIVWAGRIDQPALAYAAMDVLVLPSIYEAFGLVLVEAMAAGVPVIGRACNHEDILTASDEIITDGVNGFVVDSHNPQELADRLFELMHNRVWCETLGRQAAATVQQYTWQDYTRQIIKKLKLTPVKGANHEFHTDEYRHAA